MIEGTTRTWGIDGKDNNRDGERDEGGAFNEVEENSSHNPLISRYVYVKISLIYAFLKMYF